MKVRHFVVVLGLFSAIGCKKPGTEDPATTPNKSNNANVSTTLGPFTAKQDLNLDLIAAVPAVAGTTYALTGNPSWMTIDADTGRVSGIPVDAGLTNGIKLTTKTATAETTATFDVIVVGDPLVNQQWAFDNTAQNSFSKNSGVAGEDIKVRLAHRFGALGRDVTVLVSDEGAQIGHNDGRVEHEDLVGGIYVDKSKNYLPPGPGQPVNPAPYFGDPYKPDPTTGNHGTSVSGIIGARGWNQKGVRGVAPESRLAATNYLLSSQSNSIGIDQASNGPVAGVHYDVFNYSYGDSSFTLSGIDPGLVKQYIYGVSAHRSGKGSVYVKAAGNSYNVSIGTDGSGNPILRRLSANHEEGNTTPWTLVIGAVNANGVRSSYSSAGSNLWVSAPGGEFGSNTPAIVTTDEASCMKGYSRFGVTTNPFQGGIPLNANCDYTSSFNGTSSATPHVAGTVALMMGANPNLSWREIRHLLGSTATKVDPTQADVTATIGANTFVLQDGWVTNAAGYHFSPLYGIGRIDANAAVRAAAAYTAGTLKPLRQTVTKSGNCPGTEFCFDDAWINNSGTLNTTVVDNDAAGIQNAINVAANYVIESVQIKVDMTTVRNADIGLRLTSPSGTSGNILEPRAAMTDSNMVAQVFLSNRYYGESSAGNWTLKVIDAQTATNSTATIGKGNNTLVRWSINIVGHEP